ncbi:hypothetical protein N422_13200 [Lacticaseibacillus paracasei]|jgi:hypothetical protein|nr:hypothetical protein N422_13200 [Lacticaseibacillus paracasei]
MTMLDWKGKPIPFDESVITNVGPEGDNIKDDPKEIRKYILVQLSGVAIAANDERKLDYE